MSIPLYCKVCGNLFTVNESRKERAHFCSYRCYWSSLVGSKASEETKRKMSLAQKGREHTPQEFRNLIVGGAPYRFKNGHKLGLGRKMSAEARKKVSEHNARYWLGKKRGPMPEDQRKRVSESRKGKLLGKLHFGWKGGKVGYRGLHRYVRKHFMLPDVCEICGEDKELNWASKKHSYVRDRNTWLALCDSCHRKYDMEWKSKNVS